MALLNLIGLNPAGQYSLAFNCVLKETNGSATVWARDLPDIEGALLDQRMNIVSYENTLDPIEYFNYYRLLSWAANKKVASGNVTSGRFLALLDNGYVPYFMPPTFMKNEGTRKAFLAALVYSGVPYIEYVALNIDGKQLDTEFKDIWVSKSGAADYMKLPISKFVTFEFIAEVFRNAINRV